MRGLGRKHDIKVVRARGARALRTVGRWGAAASGIALVSAAGGSPAVARDWRSSADGGVFFAMHVGPRWQIRWGLGLEARGAFVYGDHACGETAMLVFTGAVARAELVGWQGVRLTVGPAFGMADGYRGLGGDLTGGMFLPLGAARGAGLVGGVGLDGTAAIIPNLRVGYTMGARSDFLVGVGARLPTLVPPNGRSCQPGRPVRRDGRRAPVAGAELRVDAGVVVVEHARSTGRPERADAEQRASRVWLRRATMEWASVPAFCELSEQLRACGAPAVLQTGAQEAAADELRHAVESSRLSLGLSGGAGIVLDPPLETVRAAAQGREGLARLVVESWKDGCLGEGAAAALATDEADAAGVPNVARAQRSIAADEKRHAELAWQIIAWALRADPAHTRPLLTSVAALEQSARIGAGAASGAADTFAPGLGRYGIADGDRSAETAADVRVQSQARLRALLAA